MDVNGIKRDTDERADCGNNQKILLTPEKLGKELKIRSAS
jgi:hypothetical protein